MRSLQQTYFPRHARLYLSANKLLSSQVTAFVETSGVLHEWITAAKFTGSLMGLACNGPTSGADWTFSARAKR